MGLLLPLAIQRIWRGRSPTAHTLQHFPCMRLPLSWIPPEGVEVGSDGVSLNVAPPPPSLTVFQSRTPAGVLTNALRVLRTICDDGLTPLWRIPLSAPWEGPVHQLLPHNHHPPHAHGKRPSLVNPLRHPLWVTSTTTAAAPPTPTPTTTPSMEDCLSRPLESLTYLRQPALCGAPTTAHHLPFRTCLPI